MKKKKKIGVFLVGLLIIFSFSVVVSANARQNLIQSAWTGEEMLHVLCSGKEYDSEEYEMYLDGNELPISVSDVRSSGIASTVFCLVDVSGSMDDFKMTLLRDTLLGISEAMGENDTMVITPLDDKMSIGAELRTEAERQAAIGSIEASDKDTNLYSGMVDSLDYLSANTDYNRERCLVVISDGLDCQDDGMTEQEVLSAVRQARLPVYTVAAMSNAGELGNGKILGSFARNSFGGRHFTTAAKGGEKPLRTDVNGKKFGKKIWKSLQNMAVLTADIAEIRTDSEKSSVPLSVSLISGSNVYTDEIELDSREFSDGADGMNFERILPVVCFVCAALAVVLAAVFFAARKKSRENTAAADEEPSAEEQEPAEMLNEPVLSPDPPSMQGENFGQEQMYTVHMTDIPYGAKSLFYSIPANRAAAFGRDRRSGNILDPDDKQLSGIHFSIIFRDGVCCIRDEESTNGTLVNGVSIAGRSWFRLRNGDKIRAGSCEYRITIGSSESGRNRI